MFSLVCTVQHTIINIFLQKSSFYVLGLVAEQADLPEDKLSIIKLKLEISKLSSVQLKPNLILGQGKRVILAFSQHFAVS